MDGALFKKNTAHFSISIYIPYGNKNTIFEQYIPNTARQKHILGQQLQYFCRMFHDKGSTIGL